MSFCCVASGTQFCGQSDTAKNGRSSRLMSSPPILCLHGDTANRRRLYSVQHSLGRTQSVVTSAVHPANEQTAKVTSSLSCLSPSLLRFSFAPGSGARNGRLAPTVSRIICVRLLFALTHCVSVNLRVNSSQTVVTSITGLTSCWPERIMHSVTLRKTSRALY
jgi:hypothetical protein